MIKVMIADDDSTFNSSCCKYLNKDDEIKIVSLAEDGESALKYYKETKPDVLLLDLNMPKINGLQVIDTLCTDINEKYRENIIVITGSDDMRYKLLNTSKVFKIITKPFDFEYLLKTIKEIPIHTEVCQKKLRELLLTLKFNIYSMGTIYLIDAINLSYSNPILLKNMGNIYFELSKIHNIDANKIKWSIRNSIETMNRAVSLQKLISIFPAYDTYIKITPKYFISLVIEYFLNE